MLSAFNKLLAFVENALGMLFEQGPSRIRVLIDFKSQFGNLTMLECTYTNLLTYTQSLMPENFQTNKSAV